MFKPHRIALAVALAGAAQVNATPFMPMDARGLAMGNTGVASARLAHAPSYNPSLLVIGDSDDKFAALVQAGVNFSDEQELIDEAELIESDIVPQFEDLLEDNGSDNFTSAIEDLQNAATQLENQMKSIVDPDDGRSLEDRASAIRTDAQALDASISSVEAQLDELNSATSDLTSALNSISGDPLRARLGANFAIALPGEKFAAAFTVKGTATISGRSLFSNNDQRLLEAYGLAAAEYLDAARGVTSSILDFADSVEDAADEDEIEEEANSLTGNVNDLADFTSESVQTAQGDINIISGGVISSEGEDPDLDSRVEVIGIGVVEYGLSFAHKLDLNGKNIAIGITPKLQKIDTYHYVTEMDATDAIDEDAITDSKESYSHFNLDVGVSLFLDSKQRWLLGLSAQDLLEKEFDVAVTPVSGSAEELLLEGPPVSMNAKYRAGLSYQTDWLNVALDYDLSKNDPVSYEAATQFIAVGAEVNVYKTLQLRGGLRQNTVDDSSVTSLGVGLSPFGVHMDITAMFADPDNLEKEAGVLFELGFFF